MIYPQHDELWKITQTFRSRRFKLKPNPSSFSFTLLQRKKKTVSIPKPALWVHQCSARAAQNIEGHHRPVIASIFLSLDTNSPSKKSFHKKAKKKKRKKSLQTLPPSLFSFFMDIMNHLPHLFEGQERMMFMYLFSRLRSRSLSELTRQITPRTKNGHAPPPSKSRKSYQSVNPSTVWTW